MSNLFDQYFDYVSGTEPPMQFHRWALITSIGAILERNYWINQGLWNVYPNLYTMFLGDPGSRKSTAIKLAKGIITQAGYSNIAANKTTKEKWLCDLDGSFDENVGGKAYGSSGYDSTTAQNLFGTESEGEDREPRNCFIMADEFNNFIGLSNFDFISLLGELWDYDDVYRSRIKNGRSVRIPYPTISILGGNTPGNFALAFPPEIIGQGFLSRLIIIHGEDQGRTKTWVEKPPDEKLAALIRTIQQIKAEVHGPAKLAPQTLLMLEEIYKGWKDIPDVRFKHYSNRRFAQLLKLCLCHSAARLSTEITPEDVVLSNTVLAASEFWMPTAIGEYGKGRFSTIAQKVLEVLNASTAPVPVKEIWRLTHKDLDKPTDLGQILQSLEQAEKICSIKGRGYTIRVEQTQHQVHVRWDLLTLQERKGIHE